MYLNFGIFMFSFACPLKMKNTIARKAFPLLHVVPSFLLQTLGPEPVHLWLQPSLVIRVPTHSPNRNQRRTLWGPPADAAQTNRGDPTLQV